jgi:5-methylcytosine-specific restriction endonuclease McrA
VAHHQVLALTSDGNPHQWLHWQDAITLQYKGLVAWTPATDETAFFGGTNRITGNRSHVEVPTIIAIKGSFKRKDRSPVLTNDNLFKRDLNTCGYCGKHYGDDNMTRDHIHPQSKGGKDTWTNVIAACFKCNNIKGSMSLNEAGMELLWVPYQPSFAEALILANRRILYDQAEYIAGFINEKSRAFDYLERFCDIKLK